jgi:hypothetical protein
LSLLSTITPFTLGHFSIEAASPRLVNYSNFAFGTLFIATLAGRDYPPIVGLNVGLQSLSEAPSYCFQIEVDEVGDSESHEAAMKFRVLTGDLKASINLQKSSGLLFQKVAHMDNQAIKSLLTASC